MNNSHKKTNRILFYCIIFHLIFYIIAHFLGGLFANSEDTSVFDTVEGAPVVLVYVVLLAWVLFPFMIGLGLNFAIDYFRAPSTVQRWMLACAWLFAAVTAALYIPIGISLVSGTDPANLGALAKRHVTDAAYYECGFEGFVLFMWFLLHFGEDVSTHSR